MIFSKTQWLILGNLFQASSATLNLQANSTDFNVEFVKAYADLNEVISLTILTFNDIISKVGEYRELSQEAFAFLEDDLERAVNVSEQIADEANSGYSDGFKAGMTILKSKLEEVKQKVERHLKRETGA